MRVSVHFVPILYFLIRYNLNTLKKASKHINKVLACKYYQQIPVSIMDTSISFNLQCVCKQIALSIVNPTTMC